MSPLFRPEVIEARRDSIEGEIVLAQPVRSQILVILLFATITSAAVWLSLGSYARTETARGILVTNDASAKVVVTRPGVLISLSGTEGEYVRAGQRLAVVRTENPDASGHSSISDSLEALEGQHSLAEQQIVLSVRQAASQHARLTAELQGVRQQRGDLAAQIALQH